MDFSLNSLRERCLWDFRAVLLSLVLIALNFSFPKNNISESTTSLLRDVIFEQAEKLVVENARSVGVKCMYEAGNFIIALHTIVSFPF